MNSTESPSRYIGMNGQCFATARLTWVAYGDGSKRENNPLWKYRIIVASVVDVPCRLVAT